MTDPWIICAWMQEIDIGGHGPSRASASAIAPVARSYERFANDGCDHCRATAAGDFRERAKIPC